VLANSSTFVDPPSVKSVYDSMGDALNLSTYM